MPLQDQIRAEIPVQMEKVRCHFAPNTDPVEMVRDIEIFIMVSSPTNQRVSELVNEYINEDVHADELFFRLI